MLLALPLLFDACAGPRRKLRAEISLSFHVKRGALLSQHRTQLLESTRTSSMLEAGRFGSDTLTGSRCELGSETSCSGSGTSVLVDSSPRWHALPDALMARSSGFAARDALVGMAKSNDRTERVQ